MKNSLILGFFDGVHAAHRVVINSAADFKTDNIILLTFKESPAVYFGKQAEYILSRENSYKKIKALGVNQIFEYDFSSIVNIKASEYLENIVREFSPVSISTGFNHTFGFNREGNSDFLKLNTKKYRYEYICTPPQMFGNEIICSSKIRELLRNGFIEDANKLLESNFVLEGTVIKGAQIGRTIGFPTANIVYPPKIVKIPYGVYAVNVNLQNNSVKKGIMNWGIKPTINTDAMPIAEIHIFDYQGNLYGQQINAEIIKKIRGEKKFSGIEELKTQIEKDISECLML